MFQFQLTAGFLSWYIHLEPSQQHHYKCLGVTVPLPDIFNTHVHERGGSAWKKGVVFRENIAKLVPSLVRPLLASTYTSGAHSEMSMCTRTIMTTTCTCSVHMPIQSRQRDKCTDAHTDRCTHRCTVECTCTSVKRSNVGLAHTHPHSCEVYSQPATIHSH